MCSSAAHANQFCDAAALLCVSAALQKVSGLHQPKQLTTEQMEYVQIVSLAIKPKSGNLTT